MKKKRHELILSLIKENDIATQEELLEKLLKNGFSVTQATVSRDINELHLIKVQGKFGQKYAINEDNSHNLNKFHTIFAQSVIGIDVGGNICCVKCFAGTANAAAATIDALKFSEVVGTLAGDDTLFVLLKTEQSANEFKEKLLTFLHEG
ncbi:MAG: arginine repressor [Ruminococcaceae bacterium]|nr:arginine repressor [Oscillospiraceae bacterium]